MPEALFKARDDSRALASMWERGMCVCVQPDGHQWSAGEALPDFVVVRFVGPSLERLREVLTAGYDEPSGVDANGAVRLVPVRRRLWQIMWADLPAGVRARFATGRITIGPAGSGADYTWAQVRTYFRNLRTGAAAPTEL